MRIFYACPVCEGSRHIECCIGCLNGVRSTFDGELNVHLLKNSKSRLHEPPRSHREGLPEEIIALLVVDGRPTKLVRQVAEDLKRRLVVRVQALLLVVSMPVLLILDQFIGLHEGVIHPLTNDLPYAVNISDPS